MRLIVWPPVPIKQARSGCVFRGLRRDLQFPPAAAKALKCRNTNRLTRYSGDQPKKAVFAVTITRAGFGTAVRVRMIAADDFVPVRPRRVDRCEVIGGIDFKTIIAGREIARRMKRDQADRIAFPFAFHQSAAFARECCAGFARDPFTQSIGKKNRRRHGLFGTIRPMRWPSLALKI